MEHILNDFSRPLFIMNNDVIIPFTNNMLNNIGEYFVHLTHLFYVIGKVTIMTTSFIIWHLVSEITERVKNFKFMPELIVCALTFLTLGTLLLLDHQTKILDEQKKQIETLKKSVSYLNSIDFMRNQNEKFMEEMKINFEEMKTNFEEINTNYDQTNKKISDMDKKIKKMKQEIKNL